MKEATGELQNTVIVVLSIGVLIAFFYYTLWPLIRNNFESKTSCDRAICEQCNDPNGCKTVKCHAKGDKNNIFECIYKG